MSKLSTLIKVLLHPCFLPLKNCPICQNKVHFFELEKSKPPIQPTLNNIQSRLGLSAEQSKERLYCPHCQSELQLVGWQKRWIVLCFILWGIFQFIPTPATIYLCILYSVLPLGIILYMCIYLAQKNTHYQCPNHPKNQQ